MDFVTGRGVTHCDSASPMIFNIIVYVVVRVVLGVFCGPQEARHGTVWVAGELNLVFYKYDGQIAVRDYILVQDALTVTVDMFRRVGFETNLEKTKALVCIPGYIWGKWV